MNEIKVNMENLSESEREALMILVNKSNKIIKNRWRAIKGQTYFVIEQDGEVRKTIYGVYTDNKYDNNIYENRNMFKTEEEAEFESKKRKVKADLQNFSDDNDEGNNKLFSIQYDESKPNSVQIGEDRYKREGTTYFSSYYVAQQAIEKVGKERIIKYMFNGGE